MFKFLDLFIGLMSVAFGSFIWEYVAGIKESNVKPSVGLTFIADRLIRFFKTIGRLLAWISSFYTFINTEELQEAFNNVGGPIINIVISPFYIVLEYIKKINFYNHPYLVVFGSITLVNLLGFLGWYTDMFNLFDMFSPIVGFVMFCLNAVIMPIFIHISLIFYHTILILLVSYILCIFDN